MDLHFEDDNNQSLKRFEKMLRTDNVYFFDSVEFERIIKHYIDSGRINLAKKAIVLGLEQHPDTIGLRLLKAELLILEEKFKNALQLLDEIEALEPTNEEVYIQKAMLLSKQERHTEAIELLKKALKLSEESDIDILSLIGMEYLFLEDFEHALLYFRNCLEIDVDDSTNLYNIVYCYDMLEQHSDAVVFLEQHIDREPFNETAWFQLGRQNSLLNKNIESLKAFDYAILIDEQFVGAYIEKAKTLEKLERYEEAIENYIITVELEDPSAYTYLKIGDNYEKLNRVDEASLYYLKSNEQDPFLDKPLIALANLFYKVEEYQKALFYNNKLIEINDENPDYWHIYARSNLKISFFEEAAKAYEKCIDLGDNSLDTNLALADTYYFLGDYNAAIKTLLKAEIYFHKLADIDYRLGGLYFLTQSNILGKKHFLRALGGNAKKYKDFQRLFPTVHNSKGVRALISNFKNII